MGKTIAGMPDTSDKPLLTKTITARQTSVVRPMVCSSHPAFFCISKSVPDSTKQRDAIEFAHAPGLGPFNAANRKRRAISADIPATNRISRSGRLRGTGIELGKSVSDEIGSSGSSGLSVEAVIMIQAMMSSRAIAAKIFDGTEN